MTLRRFVLALTPATRAAAVLAVLALAGVGISTANTEAVVTQRFAAALEAAAPDGAVTLASAGKPLVSGSEAYWLAEKRRHEGADAALEPAAWSAPLAAGLAPGDRITISAGKVERVLQVVTVDPAPAGEGNLRQVRVTCRDVNAPDAHPVTFTAPADTIQGPPKTARAL